MIDVFKILGIPLNREIGESDEGFEQFLVYCSNPRDAEVSDDNERIAEKFRWVERRKLFDAWIASRLIWVKANQEKTKFLETLERHRQSLNNDMRLYGNISQQIEAVMAENESLEQIPRRTLQSIVALSGAISQLTSSSQRTLQQYAEVTKILGENL